MVSNPLERIRQDDYAELLASIVRALIEINSEDYRALYRPAQFSATTFQVNFTLKLIAAIADRKIKIENNARWKELFTPLYEDTLFKREAEEGCDNKNFLLQPGYETSIKNQFVRKPRQFSEPYLMYLDNVI